MTLKIGDVVVYTPPGHQPVTDEFQRFVVLGPLEGDEEDQGYVWLAEANPKRGKGIAVPSPELAADLTKVEL